MNKIGMLVLAIGLLAPLHPAHAVDTRPEVDAVQAPVLTVRVDGDIVVNADGSLASYARMTELPATLGAKLDALVKDWRFEFADFPAGAERAKARMRITLAAEERRTDNYAVHIDNVTFPHDHNERTRVGSVRESGDVAIKVIKLGGVRYPERMQNAQVEAIVLLRLRLDESTGQVLDAVAVQTSLLNVRGEDMLLKNAIKDFEFAVLRGAKQWRFEITAMEGRAPEGDLTVSVPVMFAFNGKEKAGVWRSEVRGPKREAAWLQSTTFADAGGVSDIADGEVLTQSNSIRLARSVKGVVL